MEDIRNWQAKWIWKQEAKPDKHELVYFRRSFHVEHPDSRLMVHVSADSRYRLFINGKSVSIGPLKGDNHTHYYETVDVSDYLTLGQNVLSAIVLHYSSTTSEPSPDSIWHAPKGGFLLEGSLKTANGKIVESLHTDENWKCLEDEAVTFEAESWVSSIWLGGVERVDGAKVPHGWNLLNYDDSDWEAAKAIFPINLGFGLLTPWQLTERTIPFLYEKEATFAKVMRVIDDVAIPIEEQQRFFTKGEPELNLSPNEHYTVELDAGELTTGYLRLLVSEGKGTKIRIVPSECYEKRDPVTGERVKGIRDEISDGSYLLGDSDIYVVGGMEEESYEPFWWRTFRFVRLEIEVGEEPIRIHQFHYRETGYPLDVKTDFSSSDETLKPLWDISIRTLQRCMHETYEDCPYYEQLQYSMDTRLQILFTYTISGDDRLARKAIYDYHSSLLPSGMLQSRYPSFLPQVIPSFSLYWILMVYDHYMYFGDTDLVKRYRPTIDAVLDWFDRKVNEDGLVDNLPDAYWNYVDWVAEWQKGIPPAKAEGPMTIYSLMYAVALQKAAVLYDATGRKDVAREYLERASQLNNAVRATCWSAEKGLFQDGPGVEDYSQHVQVWGVLSHVVEGEKAGKLMERAIDDKHLPQVSYAMAFFLFRALSEAGVYHRSFELWDSWRKMVQLNLTTWTEDPISHRQRSDCHAWGATPLYEFPAEVLGIQPDLPGFKRVNVQPNLGNLTWAKGSICTPEGLISVDWKIDHNLFTIQIDGPEQVPLVLKLPDGTTINYNNAANIKTTCLLPTVYSN